MLDFEKTEIEAKIYGSAYKLRRPTVSEAQAYAKKAEGKTDEETTNNLVSFLSELGLPKDVTLGMEIDHVTLLVNELMVSKKK